MKKTKYLVSKLNAEESLSLIHNYFELQNAEVRFTPDSILFVNLSSDVYFEFESCSDANSKMSCIRFNIESDLEADSDSTVLRVIDDIEAEFYRCMLNIMR